VALTDGEIDHPAGLLLLRESSAPLRVYSTTEVRDALSAQYPLLTMLGHYSGVDWRELRPGEATPLEGPSLSVGTFPPGGPAPLYGGAPRGPRAPPPPARPGGGGGPGFSAPGGGARGGGVPAPLP